MSTVRTWQTESTNLGDTLRLAAKVGSKLRGGEVIELLGDLGSGKTAFVKGLAQGIGSQDTVRSPSFTLANQYQAGKLRLYHFDFYRLQEAGILRDELAELLTEPQAVIAVEWSDLVTDVLPAERIRLRIVPSNENSRRFTFSYPQKFDYLFPNT